MSRLFENKSAALSLNLKLVFCASTIFCIDTILCAGAFARNSSLMAQDLAYSAANSVLECASGWIIFGALAFFWGSVFYLKFIAKSPFKISRKEANKKSKSSKKVVMSNTGKEADNSAKLNDALQYMQCAIDQASQAESAAARANNGVKNARLSAAYEAQCYADAARNWADKAAARTYGASSAAQDATSKAREAAYRAQAAADRAKYSAATAS